MPYLKWSQNLFGLGNVRNVKILTVLSFLVLTAQLNQANAASIAKRNAHRKVSFLNRNGKYLTITVKKASGSDKPHTYSKLKLRAVGLNGEVTIKGVKANKYIAMNSLGQVYLSTTATSETVFFDVHIAGNRYHSFRSKSYSSKYLAISTTGLVGSTTVQNSLGIQFAVIPLVF